MTGDVTLSPRTQAGGALTLSALYIEREADRELSLALGTGDFRYVLAPRQIGKSSLRVRTEQKLVARGVRCVVVDLTRIGSKVDAASWYYSVADEIAEQLKLYDSVEAYWATHASLTPVLRWSRYLREVVLAKVPEKVVVFIDEIDSILSVPEVGDDFFAAIRALAQDRVEFPELERLTFCLLGVAAPGELIQDPLRTPFNVGSGVRLEDFTRAEVDGFLPTLAAVSANPSTLLDAVFAWTDGHPYMTHRLVHELITLETVTSSADAEAQVGELVERAFLQRGRQEEPNLRYADDRFTATTDPRRAAEMLAMYRQVRDGKRVAAESTDEVQHALRLTGIVAERPDAAGRRLACRNRIAREVFDEAWIALREEGRHLALAVARWRETKRSPDVLLRGRELDVALVWAKERNDLTWEEREFLDACRALRVEGERAAIERRNTRRLAAVLGGFVVVLLMAVGGIYSQYRRAKKAEEAQRLSATLAEAARVRAEDGEALEKGSLALALSRQPGSEALAVARGLQSVFSFKSRRRATPAGSVEGLHAGLVSLQGSVSLRGHTERVAAASFSPDGTRVVTASADQTARLWDASNGRALATLQGHAGPVNAVSFSPDGTRIVTASADQTARLWNASDGCVVATLQGHTGPVNAVSFSPDGTRIVTASADQTARLWDARDGRALAIFRGHTNSVNAAFFSPDSTRIVTASADQTAHLWDARDGRALATLQGHAGPINMALFSPDGTRVVTASSDGTARLWDVRDGRPQATLQGHTSPVNAASFSPDGTRCCRL